eukprot:GFUD01048033.1.p1 GENE.GFUD01048033.1~~GFUD01048033.1.p1  ORF type:complete len:291 (-),score=40.17 GFUD01048033.1:140-982(-)
MYPNKNVKELDHRAFLSKTLWNFQTSSLFTDFIIVCSDGEVPVHKAMIVGIFKRWGIGLEDREEFECLIIPDVSASEMKEGLKLLYLNWDAKTLFSVIYSMKHNEGLEDRKTDTSHMKVGNVPLSQSTTTDTDNKRQDIEEILRCRICPCIQCKPVFSSACDVCGKSYKSKGCLIAHKLTKHSSPHSPLELNSQECPICKKTLPKGYLGKHINLHLPDRMFPCNQCKASFKRKDHLKIHMKKHTSHDLGVVKSRNFTKFHERMKRKIFNVSASDVCGKAT